MLIIITNAIIGQCRALEIIPIYKMAGDAVSTAGENGRNRDGEGAMADGRNSGASGDRPQGSAAPSARSKLPV